MQIWCVRAPTATAAHNEPNVHFHCFAQTKMGLAQAQMNREKVE